MSTIPETPSPRPSRLRAAMLPVGPALALLLATATGLLDLPKIHQALGLTDEHTEAGHIGGSKCDSACGRRRLSAANSPDGPARDRD